MSNKNNSESTTVDFDPTEPLAPVRSETKRANEALRDYARMGAARSLRKLLAIYLQRAVNNDTTIPPTKSFHTIERWSYVFGWVARVNVFDELERRAADDLWKERRGKIREADFAVSEELRALADKIIAQGPAFIKTTRKRIKGDKETGEPDTIIVTMALDGKLMLDSLDLASKLQRRAAGLSDKVVQIPINWETLSESQLQAIADGKDPLEVLAEGR